MCPCSYEFKDSSARRILSGTLGAQPSGRRHDVHWPPKTISTAGPPLILAVNTAAAALPAVQRKRTKPSASENAVVESNAPLDTQAFTVIFGDGKAVMSVPRNRIGSPETTSSRPLPTPPPT